MSSVRTGGTTHFWWYALSLRPGIGEYFHLDINQCDTTQCDTTQCDTTQCDTTQCDTNQCDTTQCDTTQCDTTRLRLIWRRMRRSKR